MKSTGGGHSATRRSVEEGTLAGASRSGWRDRARIPGGRPHGPISTLILPRPSHCSRCCRKSLDARRCRSLPPAASPTDEVIARRLQLRRQARCSSAPPISTAPKRRSDDRASATPQGEGTTIFTKSPDRRPRARVRGRLIERLGPVRAEAPPYPLASAALAPIRFAAEKQGDYGFGPMWAGQAAPSGALPAADLTRKLATDALALPVRSDAGASDGDRRRPAFSDNYLWLVHDRGERGDDGGRSRRCRARARRGRRAAGRSARSGTRTGTPTTPAATGDQGSDRRAISAPARREHPDRDVPVEGGRQVRLGEHVGAGDRGPRAYAGHIALSSSTRTAMFVGDTLFAMGCGRLFEGTPSRCIARSSGSPPRRNPGLLRARIYAVERALCRPRRARQPTIAGRLAEVEAMRDRANTVPTTVGKERETNPFVRATYVEEFARLRLG